MIIRPLRDGSIVYNFTVLAIITLLYIVIGKLSLFLAIPGTNVSPIWPAAGLALAATILFGYRAIVAIVLASFLMNINALLLIEPSNFSLGNILFISGLTGVGAALQAALGAVMFNHLMPNRYFTRASSVLIFLCIALTSTMVNSDIGSFALSLGLFLPWSHFVVSWWNWWVGDLTGVIVTTPLLLLISSKWNRRGEVYLLITVIIVSTLLGILIDPIFLYMFIPCIVWAILRLDVTGVAFINFVISIAAVAMTALGYGPFIRASLHQSLLELSLFLIVLTWSLLTLSAEFNHNKEIRLLWEGSRPPDTLGSRIKHAVKLWGRWRK